MEDLYIMKSLKKITAVKSLIKQYAGKNLRSSYTFQYLRYKKAFSNHFNLPIWVVSQKIPKEMPKSLMVLYI